MKNRINLKKNKKGEITTILIIGGFIFISLVSLTSTYFLNKKQKQTVKTKAAESCDCPWPGIKKPDGSCEYGLYDASGENPYFIDKGHNLDYCLRYDGCVEVNYTERNPAGGYGVCRFSNSNVCRRYDYQGGCGGMCNWECCTGGRKMKINGADYDAQLLARYPNLCQISGGSGTQNQQGDSSQSGGQTTQPGSCASDTRAFQEQRWGRCLDSYPAGACVRRNVSGDPYDGKYFYCNENGAWGGPCDDASCGGGGASGTGTGSNQGGGGGVLVTETITYSEGTDIVSATPTSSPTSTSSLSGKVILTGERINYQIDGTSYDALLKDTKFKIRIGEEQGDSFISYKDIIIKDRQPPIEINWSRNDFRQREYNLKATLSVCITGEEDDDCSITTTPLCKVAQPYPITPPASNVDFTFSPATCPDTISDTTSLEQQDVLISPESSSTEATCLARPLSIEFSDGVSIEEREIGFVQCGIDVLLGSIERVGNNYLVYRDCANRNGQNTTCLYRCYKNSQPVNCFNVFDVHNKRIVSVVNLTDSSVYISYIEIKKCNFLSFGICRPNSPSKIYNYTNSQGMATLSLSPQQTYSIDFSNEDNIRCTDFFINPVQIYITVMYSHASNGSIKMIESHESCASGVDSLIMITTE